MYWRDIVTRSLSHKALNRDKNVVLLDLLRHLVHANMVLATLIDNSTLHSILLTQVMLESLARLEVPAAPQGSAFTYHMNAKEMMMWDLGARNTKQIKMLEEQTGENLNHYYKLNIQD